MEMVFAYATPRWPAIGVLAVQSSLISAHVATFLCWMAAHTNAVLPMSEVDTSDHARLSLILP